MTNYLEFIQLLNNTVLPVMVILLVAMLLTYLSRRIAHRILAFAKYSPHHPLPQQRRTTLEGVFAGLIVLISITVSSFACAAQFIDLDTLVWMVGLFSAAFGLGLRPLISDFLTGVFFIIENTLDVGEKIEVLGFEGVVEDVNLRVIHVRGLDGELIVIPNGEIRQFRNYSRGEFTPVNVAFTVESKDIAETLAILEPLADEAMHLLPNLIEKWQIISDHNMGQNTELKIIAKAKFGRGADMRPRMQALIQERLAQGGVELAG